MWNKTIRFMKTNLRDVLCYFCAAIVLTCTAIAAENYRSNRTEQTAGEYVEASESQTRTEPTDALGQIILPQGAEILNSFSEVPVYCDALRQWCTHSGTDIHFADGRACALCGGRIALIEENAITIEEGDAAVRYANIFPRDRLYIGKTVEVGEYIGDEMEEPCMERQTGMHAHIEMRLNGHLVSLEDHMEQEVL